MPDIIITSDEHIGGWDFVNIISLDEILYCPAIITNENASRLVVASKNDGLDIMPVRESIKINSTPRVGSSGTTYSIKGEFNIATQSKDIDTYLNNFVAKKVVLLAQKKYGLKMLFGSELCPLSFSYQPINGVKMEDGSSFKISVNGNIPQKPVFF